MDRYKQALLNGIGADNFQAVMDAAARREAAKAAALEAEQKALALQKFKELVLSAENNEDEDPDDVLEDYQDEQEDEEVQVRRRHRRRGHRARSRRGNFDVRAAYDGRRA